MMTIDKLPDDIPPLILDHLGPRDYLAFCRTCKSLYAKHSHDPVYWRTATAATFRLPISPLLAADGPRWYWLYKKLATQTRLYTWGQGTRGNLGQGVALPTHNRVPVVGGRVQLRGRPHRPVPRTVFQRTFSTWPTEVHVPAEVGVIADLQCGGWSTTILSSDGKLYTVGCLDSLNGITVGETTIEFKQLDHLAQSTSPISQFSAGRRHVLGLTDHADILTWDRVNAKGLKVFPRSGTDFGGKPVRVAAGWGLSSAYVPERGIVYWVPLRNDQHDDSLDGLHVQEKTIPNTARTRSGDGDRTVEVVKHIVLSSFIVWITSDSKLWACETTFQTEDSSEPINAAFEVPGYAADGRELKDVQGQFVSFGVFTAGGEVLAGSVDYLKACAGLTTTAAAATDSPSLSTLLAARPPDVPALQHSGVIALAYGDYHYHALHASGHITSYGRDSERCGQLGLSHLFHGGRFRGLRKAPQGPDALLHPIALRRGRQVWFEPEKKDWLEWLEKELCRSDFPHAGRVSATQEWDDDWDRQALYSEWVEQEGRHWADGPLDGAEKTEGKARTSSSSSSSSSSNTYDDLDAYFAIAIAAAGWHSGALVLVDDDRAAQVRSRWVRARADDDAPGPSVPGAFEAKADDEVYRFTDGGFPKVTLPNGYTMPGHGDARPWRGGLPTLEELGFAAS